MLLSAKKKAEAESEKMKANVAKVPVAKPSSSPEFVARPFLKRPSESSQRMWTHDLKMIKV